MLMMKKPNESRTSARRLTYGINHSFLMLRRIVWDLYFSYKQELICIFDIIRPKGMEARDFNRVRLHKLRCYY